MRLRHRRSATGIATLTMVGLFLVGGIYFGASSQPAHADIENGHLMTVYDRGVEKSFITDAETISEALEGVGFELDTRDAVEPARDEPLIASDYQVNIYRARPVIIVDGATRQKIITPYQTPERIVADADVKLYAEDETKLVRSDDILADGAGLQLVIDRAASISLTLFGETMTMRTQGETVAELLSEKEIILTKNDRASLPLTAEVTEGMDLRVWREGTQTTTVQESMAFEVERIQDADRSIGYREIKTAGVKGERSVTYEIEVRNGEEVARAEIASVVITAPVKQVEVVGTKVLLNTNYSADRAAIMSAAGIAPSDHDYAAYIINNENTLWCPVRWQGTNGCGESYYEKFPGAETSDQVGYGLCQSTPAIKMASAGSDWRTNAVTQMKWCHSYAMGRYGSWQAAYLAKVAKGWW